MSDIYTTNAQTVIDDEWGLLNQKPGRKRGRDRLTGLSLSGGGIRSASFGLGVLHALHREGLLKKFDYLSTVSGGGFIGSSLTWFLHQKTDENKAAYGLEKDNFPLGESGAGARTEKRNRILDFIRQHGNYLDPGHGLNLLSMIAVLLRSVILSLIVYFPIMLSGLYFLIYFKLLPGTKEFIEIKGKTKIVKLALTGDMNLLLWGSVILAGIFLFLSIVYSLGTFVKWKNAIRPYDLRLFFQKWMGRLLAFLLLCILVASLPHAKVLLGTAIYAAAAAGASSILGTIGSFARFVMERDERTANKGKSGSIVAYVSAALLVYGLLLLAYVVADSPDLNWRWIFPALAVSLITGIFVNLNYVSLHRMYRDRLMETFMPSPETAEKGIWEKATKANTAVLKDMYEAGDTAPFHLINTNIILADSKDARFRGRGGDNFILSPLYCGSDATGWYKTEKYIDGKMTLATAVAISGAAVNPHTSVAGRGPTRNRLVSFLMALLNLRLGYWAANPAGNLKDKRFRPNYFRPGLRGLSGHGFHEKSSVIELSDGGHFDNTGLYELIRRKVRVIVLSEAGADPDFTFADLANAIERVRVDFGVNIVFDSNADGLNNLLPGTTANTMMAIKHKIALKGFAMGRIEYPGIKDPGTLYFIKSTLIKDAPVDLLGYKAANPEYPDQPTSDQFFDETQFEAYRELGYRITRDMLDKTNLKQELNV